MKKIYLLLLGFSISLLSFSQRLTSNVEIYPDTYSGMINILKSARSATDVIPDNLMQCSGNSSFSNLPINYDAGYTSYIPWGYKVYQSFSGVEKNSNQITFWAVFSSYSKPSENYQFTIEVHQSGELPGEVISSETLNLNLESTGQLLVGYYEIFRCTALITPISVSEGWISIQGTANNPYTFYWLNSGVGTGGNAYQEGNGFRDMPMAICIGSGDASIPTVICNPIDINLDADGNYKLDSLDMVEITGISPDSLKTFDDLMIYAYPDTFTCSNIEWPVFVRITETIENYKKTRCWAMVTVHDSTPPTISGTNIELSLDETGQAVLTTQMVTDSAVDACGIDTISLDKSIFTCDDLGENTVVLTAVDLHGNMAADTILVTVTDNQIPVVEPVTDLEITVAPGVCWTTIEYPIPVINDNCTYTLTQTGGLGPDAQFPVGTTTESWIVTDAAGNSTEIEFNVIIVAGNGLPTIDTPSDVTEDEDTPEILIPVTGISYGNDCKAQTVELTAVSDNNELISDIEVSYTDGESEAELKLTIAPDMNGTVKVTLTVKDEMDGMIYKTFNVTISPVNDSPVVVKPVEDQIVNASYVLKVPVSSALGELFDDADGDVLTLTAMMENGTPLPAWAELVGDDLICSPMIEDKGNYTVVVKAADPEGASATDTFVVVVDGYPVSTPSIDAGFDVAMYPNPTAGRVQIELKNSGSKIEIAIFSITGSEVFRNTYYNTHLINLNMNEKGSGVYLVNINVDSKNVIKKLVVDKK